MSAEHNREAADRSRPAAAVERGCGGARAWLEVDLAALRQNAESIARHAGRPLLAMVKADGYGLGARAVVGALEPLAPWGYGVATVAEGQALRADGVRRPIVVFTPLLAEELAAAHHAQLTPSLHRTADVAQWTSLGGGPWHLAIDTGMNRAGVRWDDMASIAGEASLHPPEGAFTHFHSADTDASSRETQEDRFRTALATLPNGARPRLLHAENSAGVEHSGASPWSLVRPGVFLYGVGSGGALRPAPVAHLRARVVDLRLVRAGETVSYGGTWRAPVDSRVATLACGYADGYRRHLGNRGEALLGGHRVHIVGRVTMDMTMLDATDVPCEVGDVATLLGREPGPAMAGRDDVLTVSDVAAAGDLSPYELLTGLRQRLARHYLHAS